MNNIQLLHQTKYLIYYKTVSLNKTEHTITFKYTSISMKTNAAVIVDYYNQVYIDTLVAMYYLTNRYIYSSRKQTNNQH